MLQISTEFYMHTKNSSDIPASEITPKHVYLSRREFMRAAGLVTGGLALVACGSKTFKSSTASTPPGSQPGATQETTAYKDELGDPANSFQDITHYNNYYEFTTDKEGVAKLAENFPTSPWEVDVYGLVANPRKFSVDELIKKYQPEDHVYRLRCVEAWSMVIPWVGFSLNKLLNDIQPTSQAKFVRFETILDPKEMPGQNDSMYPWPYQEGLRLDEAMHDLTLLATGMYGGELPATNGGGIRVVVPWKYGFKSIKAIVKIELVAEQPDTLWNTIAPQEYGFYSNVNPEVDHPRWSQATERRIGELKRRPTLMFNGYADQVASLYTGMDLRVNY
jgi:methionine sulfoxide reductase catalytic subunit